jgi:UDP-N-acetyl-D-galactosamine dehydrogenase
MTTDALDCVVTDLKVAVIGLGYVGLPLAMAFGRYRDVIGFDLDSSRVLELRDGFDSTGEVGSQELSAPGFCVFTSDGEQLSTSTCYIVAVPTPIDCENKPDLSPLMEASELVGTYLKDGDLVIYESTVYPGVTDDICAPILSRVSGLAYQSDHQSADHSATDERGSFFCGYSPERINPGDKSHRLEDVVKVTSGSTEYISEIVDRLYRQIITAGTYRAKSIKVAEAAKVIENTQRDLNIALINEISIICNKLDIDTHAVLDAAATKWNFVKYTPGLVGGHCIGVDPYYLTYKAEQLDYCPEVILAGRALNDRMPNYIADRILEMMACDGIVAARSKVLVMGAAFKENCPDIRNSKALELVDVLANNRCTVDICDPVVSREALSSLKPQYEILDSPQVSQYDVIVIAVAHQVFIDFGIQKIKSFGKPSARIFDIKALFPESETDFRL